MQHQRSTIGISWTDDQAVAEFFANDFLCHQPGYAPGMGGIVSCAFDPKEIAFFKNENGEREFLVSEPAALAHVTDQMSCIATSNVALASETAILVLAAIPNCNASRPPGEYPGQ